MSTEKPSGMSRRRLLKGAGVTLGAAAGSGAITGFPTIWAQNIKDMKIVHVGQSYSTIQNIAAQASKDLGFTVEMQTVNGTTQVNRVLTQPQTMDVIDISNTQMKYYLGR